jgi:hypothetical protein
MITRVENEIVELHQFFQDWYNNILSPSPANFARCEKVLADSFTIIFPNGEKVSCKPLLEGLRSAHHSRTNMRIWIENIQVLYQLGELILATYEEWQEIEGKVTIRVSSVLFRKVPDTPNNLLWLHVHETWLNSADQ